MNDNSSLPTLTFEPISNIRLTRMPDSPQPKDKLYNSAGVMFRISERFVYKLRLNTESPWQLYDGVTIPRKEDLVLVGNPNRRTSKLVYILADRAEYRMQDISEIPFVTLATTQNIISMPVGLGFGQQSNDFRFTFGTRGAVVAAVPQSRTQADQMPSNALATLTTVASPQPRHQTEIVFPVAACIAAVTSYFTSRSGSTAQKRSRETACEEDQDEDMEANRRPRRRLKTISYVPSLKEVMFCGFPL